MTREFLSTRLAELRDEPLPLPGAGETPKRLRRLMEIAREDVSLAKLAEAHWDALAILAEAGRTPVKGSIYGVWASEIPGKEMLLEASGQKRILRGTKPFCSGAGYVDRVLITAGEKGSQLVDIDLRAHANRITRDDSQWKTEAFRATNTATMAFDDIELDETNLVGTPGWYTQRPGFWHGACGPAACWAGGAAGLLDYALQSRRSDPHTLAHLAAISANVWALEAVLQHAGEEIDGSENDGEKPLVRALSTRHIVEQLSSDVLRRFARAYGPYPLAMDETMQLRYHETELYLRQCHGERDLESLARAIRGCSDAPH